MYLAVTDEGATIAEIAKCYGISKNHLVKVAHNLSRQGYVHAQRGKSGGLRLARAPREINIGQVVRDTEPNFYLVECFNPKHNACPITASCRLTGILFEAKKEFMAVLNGYSLSDLLGNKEELRRDLTNAKSDFSSGTPLSSLGM
jgi:Rrf2 family nitric oxide-sensitive transcriptional repressor